MRYSQNFLMTLDPAADDYALRLEQARSFARVSGKGLRIRGRLGQNNPNRDLYAVGGSLYRPCCLDIQIQHAARVDVYLKG
jgi:hypothetical protein